MYRNTYVEINNSAIEHNAKLLSETFPHTYNIAVVKGNAYGHGYGIIPALVRGGMNAFAVSNLWEALEVRKYDTEHPVIILQPVPADYLRECAAYNISVCVNDRDTFEAIVESGFNLKLQFKVNCGMNRLGYRDGKALREDVDKAQSSDRLSAEGIFSHFHTSGLTDTEYAANRKRFEEITAGIDLSKIPMVHIDKTQTILLHDTPTYCNGARFGISLYGFTSVYPYDKSLKGRLLQKRRDLRNKLNHVEPSHALKRYDLKTAFTLYSEVIQVNKIDVGEYAGYGLLHKADKPEYIAVIDTGYSDGIGRKRSNTNVCINGKKYPIVGEVGMGMCQVLVDETVKKHDKVTVLGSEISIRGIAHALGTTTYETMTSVKSEIDRKYI